MSEDLNKKIEELQEDDLDAVAGGLSFIEKIKLIIMSITKKRNK